MKAAVVHSPGGPEVLQLQNLPDPQPKTGWILIKIRAFGLNRSEMFTRQGHSGDAVQFPRVLGIECVGEVLDGGGTDLQAGQKVAAFMGEMGRAYDGGYAEMTLVPREFVHPLETNLPWKDLAALPETFITAWGSLIEAMDMKAGQTLLVRGGTSSVGMAATTIAKYMGMTVIATSRQEKKRQALLENGADHVVIDGGSIAEEVKEISGGGVHGVLELVGTVTLPDSLQAVLPKGTVCFTGILGNSWVMDYFAPFEHIPPFVKLTTFHSGLITGDVGTQALQEAVNLAEAGTYKINIDSIFTLDQIVEAHQYMESNQAKGKLVVVND